MNIRTFIYKPVNTTTPFGNEKMIFQNVGRLTLIANHLHSFKHIHQNRCWWQSDFKRNMSTLLLNKTLINGEWVSASSNAEVAVINPANGSIVGQVPDLDVTDVQKAIDAAHTTFHSNEWSSLTAKERSGLLKVCEHFNFWIEMMNKMQKKKK